MIELNNKQKIIIAIILTIILLVIGYYIWDITQNNSEIIEDYDEQNIEDIEDNTKISQNTEIIIHIAGAVENEGIQKLPENSRVADAIEAAGGLTSDANVNCINLAQKIADGQKIYIPFNNEEETSVEKMSEVNIQEPVQIIDNTTEKLVNINTATQTELETLSGIGTSTATKIINYRKENGKFKSIEDIKNVSGIGESKYENIKNNITI